MPNKPRVDRPSSLTIVGEPDTPECGAPALVPASVHRLPAYLHPSRVCPVCQSAFVPGRSDQVYCGRAHKSEAHKRRARPHVSGSPVTSLCRCCGRSFVQTGKVGRNLEYCGDACRVAAALWRADVRWWEEVAAGWAPTRDAEMIEWSRSRLAKVRALSGAAYLKTRPWPVPHSTPGMERMYAFSKPPDARPPRSRKDRHGPTR